MGKRWRRNRKNKHTGEGKPRDRKQGDPSKYGQERDPYKMIAGGNYKMEAFYSYQGIHDYYLDTESGTFKKCETNEEKEEERKRWVTALKSMLPASFRIGRDVHEGLRERLEKELEDYVGKKMELVIEPKGGTRRIQELDLKPEKKVIAPAKKLGYVPHGYQLSVDRQTIRRNTSLSPFFEWLKVQTQAGFITRQETVSMIPPVVLDPQSHHKILDMCAAPGSKTSQLLEVVNIPANANDHEPTGVVVANDADSKRAYLLVHQLRRINSPAAFVTTCDAQFFPLIRDKEHPTEGIFDRVLCDVPCAGDGTSRKNPGVWKKWNQLNAYGLHTLQLSIALKGARLTKVGGYLCYSTCSMNPMENESVVAELLRASEGSLELIDRRSELPGLIARPGMTSWKVLSEDKSMKQIKNWQKKNNDKMKQRRKEWEEKNKAASEEKSDASNPSGEVAADKTDDLPDAKATEGEEVKGAEIKDEEKIDRVPLNTPFEPKSMDTAELKKLIQLAGLKEYACFEDVPFNLKKRIRKSCFPPRPEEIEGLHLERCMRVMPQDMDTGGFFVALLKKVAPMNPKARERFQNLENELREVNTKDDDVDDEPKAKKAKIETSTNQDAATDGKDSAAPAAETPEGANLVPGEKDSTAVVRGQSKKSFLVDKDGKKHESLGKDDFVPVPDNLFGPIKKFYGLSSDTFAEGNYMIRAGSDAKVLYFITKTVHSLIDDGIQQRLTVINSGLKGFVRNNKECEVGYRVAQEGVHFVAPHMTKRKIGASMEDFKKCLRTDNIPLNEFSDEFAAEIRSFSMGSYVVYLKGFEDDYIKKLVLCMWRCRGDNVNALVNQAEIDGMKSKVRSILNEDEPSAKEMVEE